MVNKPKKRWVVCLKCHTLFNLTRWYLFKCGLCAHPSDAVAGTVMLLSDFLKSHYGGNIKIAYQIRVPPLERDDMPEPLLSDKEQKVIEVSGQGELRFKDDPC